MSDDIRKLAADLTAAGPAVRPFARKAVQVTAHHIKDEWRAAANRTGLAGYAADVTYETRENVAGVVAEIGPTPGDSGSFGLVEDAPGNVYSSPQHAGRSALENNEDDFVRGIDAAVADALRAVGL
ncbi:hypothetical protein FVO59_11970 [Microbacterium esteraromaticum]|uniref:HK97 gp10 family phage protein n=1 Tax=Microbacterium esteraromaticum TaxID=57043 RepID=A0A7D8AHQ6_9MICO|nr:hypothetical protein [Microbacterium esteraromaticum]QMU97842.1 hypothetical protein FVO59_11970 [Microbacterium esteraromaticum]